MRVAKHWRNRKLRYRLIRNLTRNRSEGGQVEPKRLGVRAPDHQADVLRVKVLS